jgi:hypothetical protein
MRKTLSLAVMLCIVPRPAGLLAAPVSAADAPNQPRTFKIKPAPDAYTTDENLRNAVPMEMPTIPPEELARLLKQQSKQPDDLPKSDRAALGVPVEVDVSAFPYSAAGKLFVWFPETPPDRPVMCSAQFVGGLNVILTAAHCLQHMNGVLARHWVFMRGYRSGAIAQRVELRCPAIMNGWIQSGVDQWRYDYAFMKTQTASTGGFLGLDPRLPPTAIEAIGYPKNFGNTERMQRVWGTRGTIEQGHVRMDHNPFRAGILGGASGGAWHVNGMAMGNNSRWVEGMWSPQYDADTVRL